MRFGAQFAWITLTTLFSSAVPRLTAGASFATPATVTPIALTASKDHPYKMIPMLMKL
jgi:hypothetical protein